MELYEDQSIYKEPFDLGKELTIVVNATKFFYVSYTYTPETAPPLVLELLKSIIKEYGLTKYYNKLEISRSAVVYSAALEKFAEVGDLLPDRITDCYPEVDQTLYVNLIS